MTLLSRGVGLLLLKEQRLEKKLDGFSTATLEELRQSTAKESQASELVRKEKFSALTRRQVL